MRASGLAPSLPDLREDRACVPPRSVASVGTCLRRQSPLTLALAETPESEVLLEADQLSETAIVTRLQNKLTGLDRFREGTRRGSSGCAAS